MAKATPIIEKVPIIIEEKVTKINLELSLDEAKTLYLLTGICMGSPNSPRRETDKIYEQLSTYFVNELTSEEFFNNYHPVAWKDTIGVCGMAAPKYLKFSNHLDNILLKNC